MKFLMICLLALATMTAQVDSVEKYKWKVISGKNSKILPGIRVEKMNSHDQFIGRASSQSVAVDSGLSKIDDF